MFKIRQVYKEKQDEFAVSTLGEEDLNTVVSGATSEETEEKNEESKTSTVTTTTVNSKPKQTLIKTNSSISSNAMRASNYENGFESDYY
jgi:hypothetical protein